MHFHANPINLRDNGISNAQAVESALAIRRAKELRDVASRLKASALDLSANEIASDHESVAPQLMIGAWAGQNGQSQQLLSPQPVPSEEEEKSLATKPTQAVSFWA